MGCPSRSCMTPEGTIRPAIAVKISRSPESALLVWVAARFSCGGRKGFLPSAGNGTGGAGCVNAIARLTESRRCSGVVRSDLAKTDKLSRVRPENESVCFKEEFMARPRVRDRAGGKVLLPGPSLHFRPYG